MKKTLALILALIMILSVALVACGEKEEETQPNDDFFADLENEGDETVEGDETGETGNNNLPVTNTTFVAMNDTVYVCYNAIIRKDAKISTTNKVAEVTFGTALQRLEANSKWSKVKVGEVEGYIANDLITTSAAAVTFKTLEEPVKAKITNLGNLKTANLRRFPLAFAIGTAKVIDEEKFNIDCILGKMPKDTEVTIISISEDGQWAYVKGMAMASDGQGDFVTETTELEGYCIMSALSYKVSIGNDSNGFFG